MTLFAVSVVLLLAWGALAVGGWPSWAAAPVVVFAATTGLLGFLERGFGTPPAQSRLAHRPVIWALCLFVAAIGVQLLPMPQTLVSRLSPAHDVVDFERALAIADHRDPQFIPPLSATAPRPLSIAPLRTWVGLAFALSLAFYTIGASRGLTASGTSFITGSLTVLGVIVALVLFFQRASGTSVMYGWYIPYNPLHRSAPFANRNHEAGWLLMVLCLSMGWFAGEVARGMRGVAPHWRDRLLWFSSNRANHTMLVVFAIGVIALAVFVSQSRSGAASLVICLSAFAAWNARGQQSKTRALVISIALASMAAMAFALGGDEVRNRIAGTSWERLDGRVDIWLDSMRALKDFWITGTGFNTYGAAMLHYQTLKNGFNYIEAHNDYLQLAVEGGLLVGIPTLILIATVVNEIRCRFREAADDTRTYWLRVGAVTGLCAIALQSLLDFTLQMSGAAAMFATLLAIAIHHPAPRVPGTRQHAA